MGGVREREDSEGGKKGGREREREMIERRERDERERSCLILETWPVVQNW